MILILIAFFLTTLLWCIREVVAAPNFKIVRPKEGNAYVLYKKHLYFKTRSGSQRGQASYYRCKGKDGVTCTATGKIHPNFPDIFCEIKRMHNHLHDHAEETLAIESLELLRETVKDPISRRYESYQKTLANLPPDNRKFLKTYKSMESGLRKLATRSLPKCRNITDLDLLIRTNHNIRDSFGFIDGFRFYRSSFFDGRKNAILFLNPKAVEHPNATFVDTIFVDGTFRTCPLKCAQLLIIYRIIDEVPWFFGFALMESRKKTLYKMIFKHIKQEAVMEPWVFMSDYENGMRLAASETWQRIETPGCTFHYRQAIRRNYATRVFPKPVSGTEEAEIHRTVLLMLYNLQFLPPAQVLQGAGCIRTFQRQNGVLLNFNEFNKYFVRYWLQHITPGSFNMFKRHHRTNNICESFNAKLSNILPKHPNIYAFLKKMKQLTIEENHKRERDTYSTKSRMTDNLEDAWEALELRILSIDEFLKLDFNN